MALGSACFPQRRFTEYKGVNKVEDKTKLFIVIGAVALVILIILGAIFFFKVIAYPKDKTGMLNVCRVSYDKKAFKGLYENGEYEVGSKVNLFFPTYGDDKAYAFSAESADDLTVEYFPTVGYLLSFTMPQKNVNVTMSPTDKKEVPAKTANIALTENPSTGFMWEYDISPSGGAELIKAVFIPQEEEGNEPMVGVGGTRFLIFDLNEGKTDISFSLKRGDEEPIDEALFCFNKSGEEVTLIEARE